MNYYQRMGTGAPSHFLTHREAAALLRQSPRTLYKRVTGLNAPPRVRPPGSRCWLYPRESLLQWANGQTPTPPTLPLPRVTVYHRNPRYR